MAKEMHYDAADMAIIKNSNIVQGFVGNPQMNFDSAEDAGVFFAQELDIVKSKTYDKVYPEMTALATFPITHELPEGAETFTYYSYEKTGMANIINTFQPEVLCVGGGVGNEKENLLGPVRKLVEAQIYSIHAKKQTRICAAELGNDAGIIGAALLTE